jgi:glyoxylase-like metal-dependent hydrolase (beta-lactamase superfamily II)
LSLLQELAPGLWHWSASHPDWTPKNGGPEGWAQEVSSYALDDGEWLVLIDPVAPPSLVEELAAGRRPVVLLTCPWHERDTASLVARVGAEVHSPPRDRWRGTVAGPVFEPGDTLPGGVEALEALEPDDLLLWIPAREALVVGDVLIDRGDGLVIPETWTPVKMSRDERVARLRHVLELSVELVLPTHGPPTGRAALEHALA